MMPVPRSAISKVRAVDPTCRQKRSRSEVERPSQMMSLGSGALFDHHFNAAHGLKIVAYLVPCAGLILDYVRTVLRLGNIPGGDATQVDLTGVLPSATVMVVTVTATTTSGKELPREALDKV